MLALKLMTLLVPALLAACSKGISSGDGTGGSGSGSSDPVMGSSIEGTFVDAPVAGLTYSVASGNSETTAAGKFTCVLGETVTFKVGNLVVGQAPCSLVVFPTHLTGESTASNNGGAVAMGVLFKSLDNGSTPGVYTLPANVRSVAIPGSLNFSTFNSSTDLSSFKTIIDQINQYAGTTINSNNIQNDYDSVHAPAAAAEIESNMVNPKYVAIPQNIGNFAGKFFLATATLASGNNQACLSAGTVNFGLGVTLAGTMGTSNGSTGSAYYRVSVFRADSVNLLPPRLIEASVTNASTPVFFQDAFLPSMTGYKSTYVLMSLGTASVLSGSMKVNGETLGGDNCVYNFTTVENQAPVAANSAMLSFAGPPSHAFGTVATGSVNEATFTVSNTGNLAATNMVGFGLDGAFSFKGGSYPGTGGNCAGTLGVGASCSVVINYSPVISGAHNDSLDLTYNNGDITHNNAQIQKAVRGFANQGSTVASLEISHGPTVNYGVVPMNATVTQMIKLTNTGGIQATGITAANMQLPFYFQGGNFPGGTTGVSCSTLNAGSSCWMQVSYTPTTATSSIGTIVINYTSGTMGAMTFRSLAGSGGTMGGLANVVVGSGTSYNFIVPVNGNGERLINVVNNGSASANSITPVPLNPPFSFKGGSYPGIGGNCAAALPPAGTCGIMVSFNPTSTTPVSGSLAVNYSNGSISTRASVGLTGSPYNPPTISLNPTSGNFGTIAVGTTKDITFTLSNSGGTTATGISPSSGTLAIPFVYPGGSYPGIGGTCTSSLASGNSCSIVTRFMPGTTGTFNGELYINYTSNTGNFGISRPLTGRGTAAAGGGGGGTVGGAVLAISDGATYSFGSILVNTNVDKTFTVTNSGSMGASAMAGGGLAAPYTFKGGSYPGMGGNCGGSLAVGASCSMVVNFAPTMAGPYNDTIDLPYNDGIGMQIAQRALTGSGTAAGGGGSMGVAVLAISDGPTYSFGTIAANTTAEKTFMLSNTGSMGAISITPAALGVPYSYKDAAYPGVGGTCGTTLMAGATCNLVVKFAPTSAGTFGSAIGLGYNNGSGTASVSRALTGSGTAMVGSGTAILSFNPVTMYNFGTIASSGTADVSLVIQNGGTNTATAMSGIAPAGPKYTYKGGSYPGAGGTCGSVLVSAGSCSVVMSFTPGTIGTSIGTTGISYNNGSVIQNIYKTMMGTGN